MAESSEHQRLILSHVADLKRRGARIRSAALPNSPQPGNYGGCRPDLVAALHGWLVIGESELAPQLADGHTAEQLRAFARTVARMRRRGGLAVVELWVPRSAQLQAEDLVENLGLVHSVRVRCPVQVLRRRRPTRLVAAPPRATQADLRAAAIARLLDRAAGRTSS